MATLLLVVIYIAFMGMGVPDSLFGAAWPAIYADFSVPVGWASFVSVVIAMGTILSSLNAAKVICRFGTAKVTLACTAMTAVGILGFSLSHGFFWLLLCSVPLGFGAGAVDAALNNYVALHYKASHLNYMQAFYGIGVAVSPYLMSLALSRAGDWNRGYRMAFWLQAGIALALLLSLPLWKRAERSGKAEAAQTPVPARTLLKDGNIRVACAMCLFTCGLEALCTGWGSTFLVEARGLSAQMGARLIIAYYAGVTLGRLGAGLLADRLKSWKVIFLAEAATLTGALLLFMPSTACCMAGLFLLGCNAVLAPNILYLAPESFGADISQSVTGLEMAAMYVGMLGLPALFGLLTRFFPVGAFPLYLLLVFLALLWATAALYRGLRGMKNAAHGARREG